MNFKNYLNRITGNSDIYTRARMLGMTLEELLEREKELGYQYRNIGIPDDEELELSPDVESYSDDTGRKFWRSIIPNQNKPIKGQVEMNVTPYDIVQNDESLTTDEKIAKIKAISSEREKEINKENILGHAKNWGGAALQLGSAFLPGGLSKNAAAKIAEKAAPKLGRKIATEVASGISKGATSGAVEGVGRGLGNDENILKTAVQDAALGAAGGAALGAAGGKVQQVLKGKRLQNYGDIDTLKEKKRSQYNKETRDYYRDYIQGRDINKDGKINFSSRGIQELMHWNPKQGKNLPDLMNDIKQSSKNHELPNTKLQKKPYVKKYEVYRGKLGDHLIEENMSGQRRYYTTKDTPLGSFPNDNEGLHLNNNMAENNNPIMENILKLLRYIR